MDKLRVSVPSIRLGLLSPNKSHGAINAPSYWKLLYAYCFVLYGVVYSWYSALLSVLRGVVQFTFYWLATNPALLRVEHATNPALLACNQPSLTGTVLTASRALLCAIPYICSVVFTPPWETVDNFRGRRSFSAECLFRYFNFGTRIIVCYDWRYNQHWSVSRVSSHGTLHV